MIINSIYMESFGKFKNYSLDFDQGMNVVWGDNEAGKSTVMAFVEMMFYGKTAMEKSSDISKSLRKKYSPWDGSAMKGELEFTYGGIRYRIHKTFKKTVKTDETALYNAQTGEELPLGREEEIGQRFFGLDVGSFEKSVYINGFGGFGDQGQTSEDIAVKLMNMAGTLEEDVSQSEILDRLSSAREKLRSKSGKKGILSDLESRRAEGKEELEGSRRLAGEQTVLLERRGRLEERLEALRLHKEELLLEERCERLKEEGEQNERAVREYRDLQERYRVLMERRAAFAAEEYDYDTLPEFIRSCDQYKRDINVKQELVEQLAGKLPDSMVIIEKQELEKAHALEKRKNRLSLLGERISSAYKPALEECRNASQAEEEAKRVLEAFPPVSKVRLYLAVALWVIGFGFGVASYFVTPYLLAGLGIALVAAGIFSYLYAEKAKRASRELAECRDMVAKLTKERMVKENRLQLEEDRLYHSGGEFFPTADCDFEAILHNSYMECCSGLAELYDRYGVEDYEELDRLASRANEARMNKELYDKAVSELERIRKAYEDHTKGVDVEKLRIAANRLKEDLIAFYSEVRAGMDERARKAAPETWQGQEGELAAWLDERISLFGEQAEKLLREKEQAQKELERLNRQTEDGEKLFLDREETEEEIAEVNRQLIDLAAGLKAPDREPEELERELGQIEEELSAKRELYETLLLAEENMKEAVEVISSSFGPMLNDRTAQIFAQITGGRYEKVMVAKDYGIQVKEPSGGYHDWRFLSSGTTDQAYLALRLAMTELITANGEKLPLLLDDVLLQYDETRAKKAFAYLSEYAKASQIILFTCRKASAEGKAGDPAMKFIEL